MTRARSELALWGIVAVALVARFWDLDGPSVWVDETATVHEMSHLSQVLGRIAFPPLYYLLLMAWRELFGDAWWTLRAFSALAGALGVFAFGRVVLALFDRRGLMLAAAAVFALMPQALALSRQVRMYPLWMLCLLVAAWGAIAAARAERPARADLLRYWLGVVAAAATHHYTVLHAGALVLGTVALVPGGRRGWRRLLLLHGPVAVAAVVQIGAVLLLSGMGIGALIDEVSTQLHVAAPFQPFQDLTRLVFLRVWPYGRGLPTREVLLLGSILVAIALAVWTQTGRRQVAFLVLVGIACPVLLLALPTRSYPRLLAPAVPYIIALVVFGAWQLWQTRRGRLLVVPLAAAWVGLLAPAVRGVYTFESEPWKRVCAAVATPGPATGILLNEPYMLRPFEVCYDGAHPVLIFPPHRREIDPARLQAFVRDKERVWIIYARATRSDRQRRGLAIIVRAGFRIEQTRRFGSVIQVHRLVRTAAAVAD